MMNQEEKKVVQKILASEDEQLEVDAIKKVEEQGNVANKQKAIKIQKMHLVTMNKDKYPLQEEEQRKEKRKYTQGFREAVEEEKKEIEEKKRREEEEKERLQIEKIKRQREVDKVVRAYEKHQDMVDSYSPSFFERLQKTYERVKAALEGQKNILSEQQEQHQKFVKSLQIDIDSYKNKEKNEKENTEKENTEKEREER